VGVLSDGVFYFNDMRQHNTLVIPPNQEKIGRSAIFGFCLKNVS
jgi:hypothetical protein